jgi:sugar O-acyltransferase (sialic acid O-acetyltransferase NeuD family)
MKEISFFGYSGHSYVCIEIAELLKFKVDSYYDQEEKKYNPFKLIYLGYLNEVSNDKHYFISIGDNAKRKFIFEKLYEKNSRFISLVHPSSIISRNTQIGNATVISAGVILNCFVKIGTCCIINTGVIIEHESTIEDYVHIAPGSVLAGNVKIGCGTFIGANSVIKQGVTVTKNCIIGAGSVVINNILESGTYVGNPAKLIKK